MKVGTLGTKRKNPMFGPMSLVCKIIGRDMESKYEWHVINGHEIKVFDTAEEAADYLNELWDNGEFEEEPELIPVTKV